MLVPFSCATGGIRNPPAGTKTTGTVKFAGWGDSITATCDHTGEDPREKCTVTPGDSNKEWTWLIDKTGWSADDFGQPSEAITDGTAQLISDLADPTSQVRTGGYTHVTLFWGTNELNACLLNRTTAPCDVDTNFITELRAAGQDVVDNGMIPVFWVPPPWEVNGEGTCDNIKYKDKGGCCNHTGDAETVCFDSVRDYIENTLRPALEDLRDEFAEAELVDAFNIFKAVGGDASIAACFDSGAIHPTQGDSSNDCAGESGQERLADHIERAL